MGESFLQFIKTIQISDIIDILIVAVIIYNIIKHFRKTRAAQLIKGIGVILAVTYLAELLNLNVISFILDTVMQVGLVVLAVIFQPELRHALEHMGRRKFGQWFTAEKEDNDNTARRVSESADRLSKTKTGALIVFERETILDDLLTGGTQIGAKVTSELLENIFVPNTPLHDGAVIIRDDKIYKASCVLPLSSNKDLSNELGTRHRAALGISEQSDCISLVVSEETGKISVMQGGDMIRNLSAESLCKLLTKLLSPKDDISTNVKKNFDSFTNTTIEKVKSGFKKIKNKDDKAKEIKNEK